MSEDENQPVENNQQPTQKEKAKKAGEDVTEVAAKGVATYFGGPVGGQIADAALNTKRGQRLLKRSGKRLAKNPYTSQLLADNQEQIAEAKPLANALVGSLGSSAGTPGTGSTPVVSQGSPIPGNSPMSAPSEVPNVGEANGTQSPIMPSPESSKAISTSEMTENAPSESPIESLYKGETNGENASSQSSPANNENSNNNRNLKRQSLPKRGWQKPNSPSNNNSESKRFRRQSNAPKQEGQATKTENNNEGKESPSKPGLGPAANTVEKAGNINNKIEKLKKAKAIIMFIIHNKPLLIIILVIIFLLLLIAILSAKGEENPSEPNPSTGPTASAPMASAPLTVENFAFDITSQTKQDFVQKVQSYDTSVMQNYEQESRRKSAQTFADNADILYDIATQNNINPEIVVVRAILEGFSPGGDSYNYWGIGCYNINSKCKQYDSFDDGVLAFVQNISQYGSLLEMMQSYSYIGDYWYNPGSDSLGGCNYYKEMEDYMSPERFKEVEGFCAEGKSCNSKGEGDCVKTNEEDQTAFAKFNVNEMTKLRKRVFGLDANVDTLSSPSCTIYAQGDPNWSSIKLGNSSTTMGHSGCAVTSIAIGISCSGTKVTIDNFNAGEFIKKLNAGSCFVSGGNIIWGCSAISEVAPSVSFENIINVQSMSKDEKIAEIKEITSTNQFVLLYFKNEAHPRGHYVVYSGINGDYFITKDPTGGVVTQQLISDIRQFVIYSY